MAFPHKKGKKRKYMRVIKRRKGSRPFPATASERTKEEINEGHKNMEWQPSVSSYGQ